MSEKFRNVVLHAQRGLAFLNENSPYVQNREYSENTQQYIDEQVAAMIKERYGRVIELLKQKIDLLRRVAAGLLEKETIGAQEFQEILATQAAAACSSSPDLPRE
jgi:cell division protease FtsH